MSLIWAWGVIMSLVDEHSFERPSQSLANIEITSALKNALKRRGITYKTLALRIGVSEKTIKRLFQEKDCSLSRLNQICEAIDLPLYDLLEFARDYVEPVSDLNPGQQIFLAEHESHFSFLFFLTQGFSLEEIQIQYQLDDLCLFRYLRDLDREGFIDLGAENKFRLLVEGRLLMKLHGPMHNLIKRLNVDFLNEVIDRDGKGNYHFNSSYRFMSAQNYREMNEDLDAVSQKYRKLAYQNALVLPKEQLIPVKWSTVTAEYSIFGKWPIEPINN